ncbi:DEAD/DEAH box helicase [Scopulibacillus cellulosilyticus]|uniref:DEAD/DEAH box helicase n=1 Tax=Scopulibacillus cellulosilyticus TaxID=2665665 RepID=A0ABW2PXF7_9BACL
MLSFVRKNNVLSAQPLPAYHLPSPPLPVKTSFQFNPDLQKALYGRHLLLNELPFPKDLIDEHEAHGFVRIEQAIADRPLTCKRCSNHSSYLFYSYHCAKCGQICYYCRQCLKLGIVKSCSTLVEWTGPPPAIWHPVNKSFCEWKGKLSEAQAKAASALLESVKKQENFLVWAVCGSGKTELLFPAIDYMLTNNKTLAIASPRTDVVLELAPRMRQAFPDVPISVLYGGSQERNHPVPFVISTTHQLLRYKDYFDLIIIDEVDAFPFNHDPMLPFAASKALKSFAPLVYLTATPSRQLKEKFLSKSLNGMKIPVRFHGYPLPVPEMKWIGNWRKQIKKGRLNPIFLNWLNKSIGMKHPVFIFVPSVEILKMLEPLIKQAVTVNVGGVHANDPDRHQKVMDFREGRLRILVTTTILERGVTISYADAAVFGADDDIFDEQALVQISGRVGRDIKHPTGSVVFFHYGVTLEMTRAVKHILNMNREGHK